MKRSTGGTEELLALRSWSRALAGLGPSGSDADQVDLLRELERLKSAAAAAQARITVAFDRSQRRAQRDAGVPERRVGQGIAAQVALARGDSPSKGARHLGHAHALVEEMPHTLAALTRGDLTELRSTLVVRETACLSRPDRSRVDAELAARPGGYAALGDVTAAAETRRIAYRLDPHAFTARSSRAVADRRVSIRPAPETMAIVSGLLPVVQGVAVHAALSRHADSLRSGGDSRSRGQIMADTLVERVTGQTTAPAVPVEVHLVMSAETLLDGDPAAAHVPGYGPVPAPFARDWIRDTDAQVWLRRLFTAPAGERLVAMESNRRCFTGLLRRFVVLRDQVCRTPWCDAPVRHVDHPTPAGAGGETSAVNAQGLCEACNYAKEAPGWRTRARADGLLETTTPTGHRHRSRAPTPPGAGPPRVSRAEISFRDLVLAC
ncbi:MAG: DUF222 domain-containing protein [Nocardioidaceae bacterium]